MSMLEWTGERYIPGRGGAAIFYEHAHRYHLAASLAAGRRVVDLASGEGYGSDLLARPAAMVVGVELEPTVAAHAADHYGAANLDFVAGDVRATPLRGDQFDLAVCFEAIEHVQRPEEVLREARRLLRDDGVLMISTPERKVYSDDRDHVNEFHEHEFYLDEFRSFLEAVFPRVEMFGQRLLGLSAIWTLDRDPRELPVRDAAASGGIPPEYCIALCSAGTSCGSDTMTEAISVFLEPDQAYVEEHTQAIQDRGRLELRVVELEKHQTTLQAVKSELEEGLAQSRARVGELETQATDLGEQVQDLRGAMDALVNSHSWRVTRPLRAASRLRSWRSRG